MLRRLGWPVVAVADACEGCGRLLDAFGHHRTTCTVTGRNHARHKVMVLAWVRVLQEAGVRIRTTGRARNRDVERYIRDTHLRRDRFDNRRMDIAAPATAGVFGGTPLFIDATVLSPLTGTGEARSRTDHTDGAVMEAAARTNRAVDYPDVELSPHAQLLHLGVDTFVDGTSIP